MKSHLLHSLDILTELTIHQVSILVGCLTVLNVLRSVDKPQRDLELKRISNDRNNLSDLFLAQLTSSLVHVDIALLANDIGESATDTLEQIIISQLNSVP